MNLALKSIGKNLEQYFSTKTYKIIHLLHSASHKDSKISSYSFFMIFFMIYYEFLNFQPNLKGSNRPRGGVNRRI
jgi:hypothetical protein